MRTSRGPLASLVFFIVLGGIPFAETLQNTWARTSEIKIEEIEVKASSNGPVVLLKVGNRAIPVFVDRVVAGSIQGALSGKKFPRPLSHDLMKSVLSFYGIGLKQVFVTLRNGIYYGTLTLIQKGQVQIFDSRSSDAIALAIQFESPIIVEQNLLDVAGIELGVEESSYEQSDL